MKITLLDGSPRNGNTSKALGYFKGSLDTNHCVVQYELINKQFKAISDYLHWTMVKFIPVSAYEPNDIVCQEDIIKQIKETALAL